MRNALYGGLLVAVFAICITGAATSPTVDETLPPNYIPSGSAHVSRALRHVSWDRCEGHRTHGFPADNAAGRLNITCKTSRRKIPERIRIERARIWTWSHSSRFVRHADVGSDFPVLRQAERKGCAAADQESLRLPDIFAGAVADLEVIQNAYKSAAKNSKSFRSCFGLCLLHWCAFQ